jgi:hypothetical protein
MKTLNLLSAGVCLILAMGCASRSHTSEPVARTAAAVSSPSANLLVISAAYGSGIQFADVTYRVNDLIHQPGVEFFARPEWLRADPTPNWNKALVIIYECNGQRRIFTTGEGGRVSAQVLLDEVRK